MAITTRRATQAASERGTARSLHHGSQQPSHLGSGDAENAYRPTTRAMTRGAMAQANPTQSANAEASAEMQDEIQPQPEPPTAPPADTTPVPTHPISLQTAPENYVRPFTWTHADVVTAAQSRTHFGADTRNSYDIFIAFKSRTNRAWKNAQSTQRPNINFVTFTIHLIRETPASSTRCDRCRARGTKCILDNGPSKACRGCQGAWREGTTGRGRRDCTRTDLRNRVFRRLPGVQVEGQGRGLGPSGMNFAGADELSDLSVEFAAAAADFVNEVMAWLGRVEAWVRQTGPRPWMGRRVQYGVVVAGHDGDVDVDVDAEGEIVDEDEVGQQTGQTVPGGMMIQYEQGGHGDQQMGEYGFEDFRPQTGLPQARHPDATRSEVPQPVTHRPQARTAEAPRFPARLIEHLGHEPTHPEDTRREAGLPQARLPVATRPSAPQSSTNPPNPLAAVTNDGPTSAETALVRRLQLWIPTAQTLIHGTESLLTEHTRLLTSKTADEARAANLLVENRRLKFELGLAREVPLIHEFELARLRTENEEMKRVIGILEAGGQDPRGGNPATGIVRDHYPVDPALVMRSQNGMATTTRAVAVKQPNTNVTSEASNANANATSPHAMGFSAMLNPEYDMDGYGMN